MATTEYLDQERVKLWGELESLKKTLEDAVTSLQKSDKATADALVQKVTELNAKIGEVRNIAEAKTPEDVMTARRAANDAVLIKEGLERTAGEVSDLKGELASARKSVKVIKGREESAVKAGESIDSHKASIDVAAGEAKTFSEMLQQRRASVEERISAIESAANAASTHAQEILNLKAKSSDAFSELNSDKEKIEELKNDLNELHGKFQDQVKESADTFQKIHSEQMEKYGDFFAECQKRIDDLAEQINGLLPGATAVGLAKAFQERKDAVQKTKWVWTSLLIGSACAIGGFGWWSLANLNSVGGLSAIPLRLVIISAFVILEEFARRNYNISTRLAEAYAYKEAIAKSYLGFKKELADIALPGDGNDNGPMSVSVLAETFLEKLGDEPGKRVFDKEKRAFTMFQALAQLQGNGDSAASPADPAKIAESMTSLFTRVSWPVVTLVLILSIAGCFVASLLIK